MICWLLNGRILTDLLQHFSWTTEEKTRSCQFSSTTIWSAFLKLSLFPSLTRGMWNTLRWNAPRCTLVSCFTMSYVCVSAQPQRILNIPPYENHLSIQRCFTCQTEKQSLLLVLSEFRARITRRGLAFPVNHLIDCYSKYNKAGVSCWSAVKSVSHFEALSVTLMYEANCQGHCSHHYRPAFKLLPPEWLQGARCWQLDWVSGLWEMAALVVVCWEGASITNVTREDQWPCVLILRSIAL